MQRNPRFTTSGLLLNLWRTGPARAHVTPSTSVAEVSEVSTRMSGFHSHSSQLHTARTVVGSIGTFCGSIHRRLLTPAEGSVPAGRVDCSGARGFSAAAAEEFSEHEFHLQAEETLHFLQERIEVCISAWNPGCIVPPNCSRWCCGENAPWVVSRKCCCLTLFMLRGQ